MIIIRSIFVGSLLLLAVGCGGDNGDTIGNRAELADKSAPAPTSEETDVPAVLDGRFM